jgi:C-8 sterol isomerase
MSKWKLGLAALTCCVGLFSTSQLVSQHDLFANENSVPRYEALGSEQNELRRMLAQDDGGADKNGVMRLLNWLKSSPLMKKRSSSYEFDPAELQQVVQKYQDLPLQEAFTAIHKELLSQHPKMMDKYRFIFNAAGGVLGQVAILYASPQEYLIFFGSPISTGGFSGRYQAEFYDIMIQGEMETVIEGEVVRNLYRPGDMAHLKQGQAKGYRLPTAGWMLEYSRGSMISNFPFGVIAPASFITLDWKSAWAQIHDFSAAVLKSSF